jgi:hypothetical protein
MADAPFVIHEEDVPVPVDARVLMADEPMPNVPPRPRKRRRLALSSDSSDTEDREARQAHDSGDRLRTQWEARRHSHPLPFGAVLLVEGPPAVWAGEAAMSEDARRSVLPLVRAALADPLVAPTDVTTQAIRYYLATGDKHKALPLSIGLFSPFALGMRACEAPYALVTDPAYPS